MELGYRGPGALDSPPPSPPPPPFRPPSPGPVLYEIPQRYQLRIRYAAPIIPTEATLNNLESAIASDLSIPTADVDASIDTQYLTSVYNLVPNNPPVGCTTELEIAMEATLCNALSLPNCTYVTAECVKDGAPGSMLRVPFFPSASSSSGRRRLGAERPQPQQWFWHLGHPADDQAAAAAVAVAARRAAQQVVPSTASPMAVMILMDNQTNNAQLVLQLFQKSISLLNWQVINPASGNVTQSSTVRYIIRNPADSAKQTVTVLDSRLGGVIATSLGVSPTQVLLQGPGVIELIPAGSKRCPKPVLGVLCGADAVGAIIGIILGGLILIGLVIMGILYSRRGRMTKVVVMDDFAWARKYAHIVPTNVIASPYVTQYGLSSNARTNVYG
ncbi:hypothetical protein GPECTOR_5g268 [Gonium pectorale]|uniref:Uncharacterized protein n=1 Tax=Gonium pectorale TaxID=33097 RepID=A0A150GWD8_GONPE|nr:hypothetical protein GPECTOR_5g268 [Gonium pectorale]|eukprot:KXZ54171.1 hypothetical protein GPECTOR_5g268 [Gonium pectorale]